VKGLFGGAFEGMVVMVTGHTGFKGSWLTTWLLEMGATVVGYSLPEAPTTPSNFHVSGLERHVHDVRGDVRDLASLQAVIEQHRPQIVFHLAAQPIVLRSFEQPKTTIDVNAGGTVNVLEAIRTTGGVRALVSITTDKVYESREWLWGYRERDRLGGSDPYSAGKAMAELAIASYRDCYFAPEKYGEHGVAVASARAGNVIGGGDFADYRLVPDCMRALMAGETIPLRNPESVRPWQHVLEPVSGYLWLASRLLQEGPAYAEAWNFGPLESRGVTTRAIVEKLIELWGDGAWQHTGSAEPKAETGLLRLSWEKAQQRLNWRPVYNLDQALGEVTAWFRAYQEGRPMREVCRRHIDTYVSQASELGVAWAR
jgi:CDP-glucose 4,6-dehydratase